MYGWTTTWIPFWQHDEPGIAGVELSLYVADDDGAYSDTGLRAQTDQTGFYEFPRTLRLAPGEYRVVERQPDGLLSVAAVTGQVNGEETGNRHKC